MHLSVFTIESVARLGNYLFSDCNVSGTFARKTGSLHVRVFGLRPVWVIAKRAKSKNRMQITEFSVRLSRHKLVLREIQGM